MGWSAISAAEELDEADGGGAGNGDAMAAGVELQGRETISFEFVRTDGASTEPWGAELYASIDNVVFDAKPCATGRWGAADTKGVLSATGARYVRARIFNADRTPTEVVVVNVRYAKDQVAQ